MEGNFFRYQGTPPWIGKETSFQLTPWRFSKFGRRAAILVQNLIKRGCSPPPPSSPPPLFSRPFNNAGRYIVWRGCISCGEWTVVMSVVMLVDKFGGWESSCCTTVPRRILTETLRNRRRRRRSINRDKTRFHERYPGGRGTGGWRSRETSLDVVGWKSWRRKGGRIDIYIYIFRRNKKRTMMMMMKRMNEKLYPFRSMAGFEKSFDRRKKNKWIIQYECG